MHPVSNCACSEKAGRRRRATSPAGRSTSTSTQSSDRSASIASLVIGAGEMALVVRSGHPLTAAGPTIEQFRGRRPHRRPPAAGAARARRCRARSPRAAPQGRRLRCRASARRSRSWKRPDIVCVLPRRLGVPDGRALSPLPLPFPLRSVPAVVSWHHRQRRRRRAPMAAQRRHRGRLDAPGADRAAAAKPGAPLALSACRKHRTLTSGRWPWPAPPAAWPTRFQDLAWRCRRLRRGAGPDRVHRHRARPGGAERPAADAGGAMLSAAGRRCRRRQHG